MAWWCRSPDCVDFYWGVVQNPSPRSSAHVIFIFRRYMVRHLQFLISLNYQPLSQMDYLSARCFYFASYSLGIPVTFAWRILGVIFPPFCWLPLPRCFFVLCLLRLLWEFLGTLAWHVPGLLRRAFLANSGRFIGGAYSHHFPPTCLLHRLGVMPSSGFYFWYHLR